jgi:hypothetical protein
MEDDPKYDWNIEPLPKNAQIWIQKADGNFVEIGPVRFSAGKSIVCEPIPGREGIHYVQDWYGLTHFG